MCFFLYKTSHAFPFHSFLNFSSDHFVSWSLWAVSPLSCVTNSRELVFVCCSYRFDEFCWSRIRIPLTWALLDRAQLLMGWLLWVWYHHLLPPAQLNGSVMAVVLDFIGTSSFCISVTLLLEQSAPKNMRWNCHFSHKKYLMWKIF